METTEDDHVIKRLRSPIVRDTTSVTGLVARYRPEIEEARRSGKTWVMIGHDLQPDDPIKADTLRRTIARAKRGPAPKAGTARRRSAIKPPEPPVAQRQLALQESPIRHNPFGRKVDPIRDDH